jgi:hypothetical protein
MGGETMSSDEIRPPIVFISYSHDSQEHADRVLALSDHLRADGIDCVLDQYEDSPPEGFPRWMDRQIRAADFVLMICTPTFYRRVMGEEEPSIGRGVAWESTSSTNIFIMQAPRIHGSSRSYWKEHTNQTFLFRGKV